jgi:hypothetical protein
MDFYISFFPDAHQIATAQASGKGRQKSIEI